MEPSFKLSATNASSTDIFRIAMLNMMTAKAVEAKFEVFDMFSPIERREGLEMRKFLELLLHLITEANNSSGGSLFVTVGK